MLQQRSERVEVTMIRTDGGTQPRANIDARLVTEYAEAMQEEFEFPPVTVFFDGTDYWLADGFHRVAAVRAIGMTDVACHIKQGTRDDAVWYSCGANATHGRRRSNEDKRRAVETALADPRGAALSNRDLARHCGVSHTFISKMRRVIDDGEALEDDELRTAATPQAISAASKVTMTGVVADPRDIEVDEDGAGALVRKPETALDGVLRDAAQRLTEEPDEDGFFEVENRGGGGGGGGDGSPREVELQAAEERPAAEKRTIKLPRDPEQAAHVILKNFSPPQIETMVAILESNL